jgi:UDP-N-acetyl-D-mannosaminuronate dehydrogenase
MNKEKTVLVVGLGEVGKPLLAILSSYYRVIGIDIVPPTGRIDHVDVMHICYPFQVHDFVGETGRYIEQYKPRLTIINSTVEVGTTRRVAEWTSTDVVHSPVRGKHARMQEEMLSYTKFIGALNREAEEKAARHFESAGLKTRTLASPEATELGKLAETTYFGVLIAWAQELERYCDEVGADYNEVISLYDEVKFFPQVKYTPGIIGGHCVMPNISILCDIAPSPLLSAIQNSNKRKSERETRTEDKNATPESLSSASKQPTH